MLGVGAKKSNSRKLGGWKGCGPTAVNRVDASGPVEHRKINVLAGIRLAVMRIAVQVQYAWFPTKTGLSHVAHSHLLQMLVDRPSALTEASNNVLRCIQLSRGCSVVEQQNGCSKCMCMG